MAFTEVTSVSVASYRLTVTGLLARTCPVRVPSGKAVAVGTGDSAGVGVEVAVADPSGVCVVVAVSDPSGVEVAVTDPSGVEVAVSEPSGVKVAVSDPFGVEVAVSEPSGVGVALSEPSGVCVAGSVGAAVGVSVGALPVTVRLTAPVDGMLVRVLSPLDTRAVHSTEVCPACKPVTVNVKAAPPEVALLPLLPAMAKIKLPFCVLLNAVAGSAPNKLAAATLLTATRFAS